MKLKIRNTLSDSRSAASSMMRVRAIGSTRKRSIGPIARNVNSMSRNPGMRRLRTMTLHEGLAYLRAPSQERKIDGFWVESKAKSKAVRLKLFTAGLVNCVSCGLRGTHFHIERHWNDHVMPFSINLY